MVSSNVGWCHLQRIQALYHYLWYFSPFIVLEIYCGPSFPLIELVFQSIRDFHIFRWWLLCALTAFLVLKSFKYTRPVWVPTIYKARSFCLILCLWRWGSWFCNVMWKDSVSVSQMETVSSYHYILVKHELISCHWSKSSQVILHVSRVAYLNHVRLIYQMYWLIQCFKTSADHVLAESQEQTANMIDLLNLGLLPIAGTNI